MPLSQLYNYPNQACAVFTRAGLSLETVVTPHMVSVTTGVTKNASSLAIPLNFAPLFQTTSTRGCTMVLNAAQDEAAVGVPLETPSNTSTASLMLVRLDLKGMIWSQPLRLDPPPPLKTYVDGRYLNSLALLGYREGSSDLIVVSSDNRVMVNQQNGETSNTTSNLTRVIFSTLTSTDVVHNRFWSSCYQDQKIFGKPQPCSLLATSLFGIPKRGPEVVSPILKKQQGVLQWQQPRFYADVGPALIFGGFPVNLMHASHFIWIANLGDSSIRQMTVHVGFHDDGMTGVAAISPDAAVLAFSVSMSKLACCLVDNYISQGDRLVIVDLEKRKQIGEIYPPAKEKPLGFAIDHHDKQTVLLVDWGDGWQRREFINP